jgi:hypothetical protein
MTKQYGAVDPPPGQTSNKYQDQRHDAEPKAKEPDPSPDTDTVIKLHKNAPTDTRAEDQHHTLGFGHNQAARGDHDHRSEGTPLFDGVTLTGAKGGNTALQSVINLLVQWGAKDTTT